MISTDTYEPKEIRGGADGAQFLAKPVTIAADQNLVTGTILGRVDETGLFVAYDDDGDDGREVAAGILVEDVDAVAVDRVVVSSMYVRGSFIKSRLVGLDPAAEADLDARTVPGHDLILI